MQLNKAIFSLVLVFLLFGVVAAKSGPTKPSPTDLGGGAFIGDASSGGSSGSTATGTAGDIQAGICGLSNLVNTVLTAVIFLLIVAAAVVYAGGQLLGAETRARATVWATSMFIGALIGVLIYVIVPFVLSTMMGQDIGACAAGS